MEFRDQCFYEAGKLRRCAVDVIETLRNSRTDSYTPSEGLTRTCVNTARMLNHRAIHHMRLGKRYDVGATT
jgi:hypothetical protein